MVYNVVHKDYGNIMGRFNTKREAEEFLKYQTRMYRKTGFNSLNWMIKEVVSDRNTIKLRMAYKEIVEARRVQIPDNLIGKMSQGFELSDKEKEIVRSKGKVYVLAHTKESGQTLVRPQLRDLPGGKSSKRFARNNPNGKEEGDRPESKYANVDDIDFETAYGGFRNTSFSPDERAVQIQNQYVKEIDEFAKNLMSLAETQEQKEKAELEIERYKDGYLKRQIDLLHARSRTASPMITGGANFPTERNQKALNREMILTNEFLEWRDKAKKKSKNNVIASFTGDLSERELEIMKNKVDSTLEVIKDIDSKSGRFAGFDRSSFVTNTSKRLERQLANGNVKLVEETLKYIQDQEKEVGLKKPLFTTRHSIYKKLETAKEMKPEVKETGTKIIKTYKGAEILNNFDAERIQLAFDVKPESNVIQNLKSNGWRWSRANMVWQRKNTKNAEFDSKIILDKFYD